MPNFPAAKMTSGIVGVDIHAVLGVPVHPFAGAVCLWGVNGLKKMLVYNAREIDLLLMHNKSFAAEIAHSVSSRNRMAILERYAVLQFIFFGSD